MTTFQVHVCFEEQADKLAYRHLALDATSSMTEPSHESPGSAEGQRSMTEPSHESPGSAKGQQARGLANAGAPKQSRPAPAKAG
jgi:hypothetical protein